MAVKAHFKTGVDQREIVMDVQVAADMYVGYLVSLSGSGSSAKITAATAGPATAGQYIVAQSDMTMGKRDYSVSEYTYSDKVSASSTLKKVALFRVIDPSDVLTVTV